MAAWDAEERHRSTAEAMASSASRRLEQIRWAVDQYQSRLIGFAARITGDVDSARDVVQDTFLRLCDRELDDIGDHLSAWLFRVCRNRALDVRKKEGPLRPLDETPNSPAGGPAADPHRSLEKAEDARRVLAAVAGLPAAQQEVLRLRFQEELSYREISKVTRHSVGNVGFLIHVAIKRLRETLRSADGASQRRAEGGRTDA